MRSLYSFEMLATSTQWWRNIPEEKNISTMFTVFLLLFRNNWLFVYLTIWRLYLSQQAAIDVMHLDPILFLFVLEPGVAPEHSATMPVTDCTNSSFVAHWQSPYNCTFINGYLYKYRFQLLSHNGTVLLSEGITHLTSANFTGLTPHTVYTVKVYLITSGGWNPKHPLEIPVQTRATS
jgi:hypothetical protein